MQLLYHFKLKILLTKTYIFLICSGGCFLYLYSVNKLEPTLVLVQYTNYDIEKVS